MRFKLDDLVDQQPGGLDRAKWTFGESLFLALPGVSLPLLAYFEGLLGPADNISVTHHG